MRSVSVDYIAISCASIWFSFPSFFTQSCHKQKTEGAGSPGTELCKFKPAAFEGGTVVSEQRSGGVPDWELPQERAYDPVGPEGNKRAWHKDTILGECNMLEHLVFKEVLILWHIVRLVKCQCSIPPETFCERQFSDSLWCTTMVMYIGNVSWFYVKSHLPVSKQLLQNNCTPIYMPKVLLTWDR